MTTIHTSSLYDFFEGEMEKIQKLLLYNFEMSYKAKGPRQKESVDILQQ